MEKIATATYSFEKLRRAGYVYVDKTDMLWRLVSETEDSQFFIARPRRFGKSLMLSTLKCIFEGKRELFKGLKIEKVIGEANGTDEPVMARTAVVRTAAVSAAGAGQGDGHVTMPAAETAAVRRRRRARSG